MRTNKYILLSVVILSSTLLIIWNQYQDKLVKFSAETKPKTKVHIISKKDCPEPRVIEKKCEPKIVEKPVIKWKTRVKEKIVKVPSTPVIKPGCYVDWKNKTARGYSTGEQHLICSVDWKNQTVDQKFISANEYMIKVIDESEGREIDEEIDNAEKIEAWALK